MEKIWFKSYPAGIPHEINPDAYHSIVEIFQKSCETFREKPAFYNMGITLSFDQIDKKSRDFAAYLQQTLKLKKGDRFAIMLPNLLQYPVALFGALRAGLTVVNVNPLYTADELTHQVNDSGATAIITLANFASTVQKALPRMPQLKHLIVTYVGDLFPPLKALGIHLALKYFYKKIPVFQLPNAVSFKKVMSEGKALTLTPVSLSSSDIAFLQYTGGTTGVSKGAILTHRNIMANLQQADAWLNGNLELGTEIIITALPLYHIFSLLANCLLFFRLGGLNVLVTNPRDLRDLIKAMKAFPFTAITGVNTLFNLLLSSDDFKHLDFSHLKLALGGGMAVQAAVAERWQTITGAPLLEAYGLTETSPCVTINPINLKSYNGTIGLPVPSTDVAILDNDGREVPIGQSGELAVKGPQVTQGYWNNPAETKKVFTPEGWLLTGDIASVDENGYVRILERKKDMVIVSGFNVYPNEVENVIMQMPGVKECAVIGVPSDHSGEVVKAFIVRSDTAITKDEVTAHCRAHLTSYKIPKIIEFTTDLPKTNVGKILRRALRKDAQTVQ